MTRQKVDLDKRQRTAQACDSCKKRKQKCDGKKPCASCSRRRLTCGYSTSDVPQASFPSQASTVRRTSNLTSDASGSSPSIKRPPRTPTIQGWLNLGIPTSNPPVDTHDNIRESPQTAGHSNASDTTMDDEEEDSEVEGFNDEEEDSSKVRMTFQMVEDNQGRLQYIGESATSSFVQRLGSIVDEVVGPSADCSTSLTHPLTQEISIDIAHDTTVQARYLLPSKEMAHSLMNSFFTYTTGYMDLFNDHTFRTRVEECYRDRSQMDQPFLCHFLLVMSLGMLLRAPDLPNQDNARIDAFIAKYPTRAAQWYTAARQQGDPLTGFENSGVWSAQALALMSLYMFIQSQRNTAYIYTGMAIRLASSLGVHRTETMQVLPTEEQQSRTGLWRSLYVLDTLLSVSLGRPMAMGEDEPMGTSVGGLNLDRQSTSSSGQPVGSGLRKRQQHLSGKALEATLRSAHTMGQILRKLRCYRPVTIKQATLLARQCSKWAADLPSFLTWQNACTEDVRHAIAILHCNIFYCHSVILLSRPFFLTLLGHRIRHSAGKVPETTSSTPHNEQMQKFSDACMDACIHSIVLTFTVYDQGYLSPFNFFPTYCVFSSALVIYLNELVRPNTNPRSRQCMHWAVTILRYCSKSDPQASQSADVLERFRDVIANHQRGGHNVDPPQGQQMMQPASAAPFAFSPTTAAQIPATSPPVMGFPGGFALPQYQQHQLPIHKNPSQDILQMGVHPQQPGISGSSGPWMEDPWQNQVSVDPILSGAADLDGLSAAALPNYLPDPDYSLPPADEDYFGFATVGDWSTGAEAHGSTGPPLNPNFQNEPPPNNFQRRH